MKYSESSLDRRRFLRMSGLGMATLAAAPVLASCATPGTTEDTLRLGALYPVSGSLALLGQESWRGVKIATDMRNKAGGVAGKQVEMVFADVPDVNAATSEARRLAFSRNIKLAVGTYSSSLSLAASEVFARTGHSFVELGAVSESVTGRNYDNVYRMNPPAPVMTEMQFRFIDEYLAGELGKSVDELKVVMAHEDSSYGQSIAHYAKQSAQKVGLKNFSLEPYNAKSTDLSSTVLRLQSRKPDIVLAVSYAADAVLLGRQIRDYGLELGAFIGTGGGHSLQGFQNALGKAANGVFDVDFTQIYVNEEFTPGINQFTEQYRKRYGGVPASGHSLANFAGANLLFNILDRTGGSDDAETFHREAQAYKQEQGTTAAGWGYKLDDHNQNTRANMYVMQWQGDKLETVWPPEAAVREPKVVTPFGV